MEYPLLGCTSTQQDVGVGTRGWQNVKPPASSGEIPVEMNEPSVTPPVLGTDTFNLKQMGIEVVHLRSPIEYSYQIHVRSTVPSVRTPQAGHSRGVLQGIVSRDRSRLKKRRIEEKQTTEEGNLRKNKHLKDE